MRLRLLLTLGIFLFVSSPSVAQYNCNGTCEPSPSSPDYQQAVQARPRSHNQRGEGSPVSAQARALQFGSESYNYAIPILGLAGRNGLHLNLTLFYNSRVWTIDKTNGTATFNADRDFPGYGFRLGFGYLESYNSGQNYLLTEPDGTKREMRKKSGTTDIFETYDSSYIEYNSTTKVLRRKGGTRWVYEPGVTTNIFRPIRIQDTNGQLGLSLQRVYAYERPKSITGSSDALLDPEGRYLYLASVEKRAVHVTKIDWRNSRIEGEKTLRDSECEWAMVWAWVPRTQLIHLRACGAHYILDAETLDIKRRLEGRRWGDGFVFSPTGQVVLISEYDEQLKSFQRALYELPSWTQIAPWEAPGQDEIFSLDGRYVIAKLIRTDEARPVLIKECGVAFYEVPSGKLTSKWLVHSGQNSHEGHCWDTDPLIPNQPYFVVDELLGNGRVVVDLRTGKIVYSLEPPDVAVATKPHVSPDGRFVVVGGWDDPEDQEWSRDFVIWDLKTRQIVYQSPKYRSVWGRSTHGRQVFPRFSEDGKYLIVVREEAVELYAISTSQ